MNPTQAHGPIPSPDALNERYALDESSTALVARARGDIRKVLTGADRRLLIIAGPCSLHHEGIAIELAQRLATLAERFRDELVIVMRAYFEKPRSGVGWKGFVFDPWLDGSHRLPEGIERSRALLSELTRQGVPCGTELLNPLLAPYFQPALAWGAIGARTAESQIHRELGSHQGFPIGVKNTVDGRVRPAVEAIRSMRSEHELLGIDGGGRVAALRSPGNPFAHLVLRGGEKGPNYFAEDMDSAVDAVREVSELERPVLVDLSHGNAGKDYRMQPVVMRAVLDQLRRQPAIAGVLMESHHTEGQQSFDPRRVPSSKVSITDGCLGWAETAALIEEAAVAVRSGGRS